MKYTETYQRTRDIDWFFQAGDKSIHVASNAGKLPDFVNDIQRLREEQAKVSMLNDVIGVQIIINTRFVDSIVAASVENLQKSGYNNISVEYIRNSYLASFIEMARKGFYSYDRYPNNESTYVLVCGPDKPVSVGMKLLEMSNEIELSNEESFFLVKTKFDEE